MNRLSFAVLFAAMVSACQRPPESTPAAPAVEPIAPSDAAPADPGRDASIAAIVAEAAPDAGSPIAIPASSPDFSQETWLRDHGVARWPHDRACWTKIDIDPRDISWDNQCYCHQALTLATPEPVELLLCQRTHEGRTAFVEHTILYVAERGGLRAVFDQPTAVFGDDPIMKDGHLLGRYVELTVTANGANIVLSDADPRRALSCAEGPKDPDWGAVFGGPSRQVCALIGTWRWMKGTLVRQPSVRQH